MIEFLRDYLGDLYAFLPRKLRSSPLSKQVKAKVMEVMGENFKNYNPLYFSWIKVRQTIHVSATDPFDLGLLPEVLEQNYCNYTYYKLVKTDLGHDLVLYNYKPKDYLWYQVQLVLFQVGYLFALLLGFIPIFIVLSYLIIDDVLHSLDRSYQAITWFLVFCDFWFSSLISLVCIDFYVRKIRQTKFGRCLMQVLDFDKIENIDKPTVL